MIQVPGYLIKREVGVGGMAMVYLAVQTSLEREVALKVMNPAMISDPSFSRRFMQEARTLASLAHPNIVAVYDVGITEEKLHYFSMQHLPNGDFLKRIQSGIPEAEIVRVLAGVARALGYAHQRGFVHRDVAPGNVLFDINDNPVLTDFGIARAVTKTSRITNAGVSVGTSHYMSPEQARGGDVDGRSDIYSLGALAFEALTGNPPYNGDDGFAIAYAHVFEPVPRLPEGRAHWQPMIDKAMAKDPAERFQNSEEFLAELARLEPQSRSVSQSAATPLSIPVVTVAIAQPAVAQAGSPVPVTVSAPTLQLPAVPAAVPIYATPAATTPVKKPAPKAPAAVAKPATADGPRRSLPKALWIVAALVVAGIALLSWGLLRSRVPAGAADDPLIATQTMPEDHTPRPQDPPPVVTTDSTPPVDTPIDPALVADAGNLEGAIGPDGLPLPPDPLVEEQLRIALATTVVDPIAFLTAMARADIAAQRLSQPPGRNATDRYQLLLRMRPDSTEAKAGLLNTGRAFAKIAAERLAAGKFEEWKDYSQRGIEVAGEFDSGHELTKQFDSQRTDLIAPLLVAGNKAIEQWDEAGARSVFQRALEIDPGNKVASDGMKRAAGVGKPGYFFSDSESGKQAGPTLVVANVGGKRLAIARSETTVAEFGRFWAAAGAKSRATRPSCRDRESVFRGSRARTWQAPGFTQGADHPVVCIDWNDAKAYVDWLSKTTGKRYRLLAANEWSALAKTQDRGASCKANIGDSSFNGKYRDRAALTCNDGFAETSPARKFAATAGINDLAGNVREWVNDCESGCRKHFALGSAWLSTSNELDPVQRASFDSDTGFNTIGMRVAREID